MRKCKNIILKLNKMAQHEHYLAVVLTALTALILASWNPDCLQSGDGKQKSGKPSYVLIALLAFLVGALCVWGQHSGSRSMNF